MVALKLQNRFCAKALDLHYKLSNANIDQLITRITISKDYELLLFISYIPPASYFVIYDTHSEITHRVVIQVELPNL